MCKCQRLFFFPSATLPRARYSSLPSLPSLPKEAMEGEAECSSAYLGRSLITCTSGAALLTPYGWVYTPGSAI